MHDETIRYVAPQESLTPRNVELAVTTIGALKTAFESLCEAAELPENEPHKEPLYIRAVQVAQIAEGLNSASPVL
ncbi:MAG: hypothetical protein OHK0019_00620 [Saprospiraceae bacterium]